MTYHVDIYFYRIIENWRMRPRMRYSYGLRATGDGRRDTRTRVFVLQISLLIILLDVIPMYTYTHYYLAKPSRRNK